MFDKCLGEASLVENGELTWAGEASGIVNMTFGSFNHIIVGCRYDAALEGDLLIIDYS